MSQGNDRIIDMVDLIIKTHFRMLRPGQIKIMTLGSISLTNKLCSCLARKVTTSRKQWPKIFLFHASSSVHPLLEMYQRKLFFRNAFGRRFVVMPGDLLSPYVFLLLAEIYSVVITRQWYITDNSFYRSMLQLRKYSHYLHLVNTCNCTW